MHLYSCSVKENTPRRNCHLRRHKTENQRYPGWIGITQPDKQLTANVWGFFKIMNTQIQARLIMLPHVFQIWILLRHFQQQQKNGMDESVSRFDCCPRHERRNAPNGKLQQQTSNKRFPLIIVCWRFILLPIFVSFRRTTQCPHRNGLFYYLTRKTRKTNVG